MPPWAAKKCATQASACKIVEVNWRNMSGFRCHQARVQLSDTAATDGSKTATAICGDLFHILWNHFGCLLCQCRFRKHVNGKCYILESLGGNWPKINKNTSFWRVFMRNCWSCSDGTVIVRRKSQNSSTTNAVFLLATTSYSPHYDSNLLTSFPCALSLL